MENAVADRVIEKRADWRTVAIALLALGVSGFACTKPRSTDTGDGGPDHPVVNSDAGGQDSKDAKDGSSPDMTSDAPRDGSPDMGGDGSPVDPGCVPNATQCNGMQPQTCDASGIWQNSGTACPYLCNNGLL